MMPGNSIATASPPDRPFGLRPVVVVGGLLLLVAAAFGNGFFGRFVFDDDLSILENPTIRDLRSWAALLSPPHGEGQTVGGRPLLNLSFALNYAISGIAPWSYHLANIAIHAAAVLTLFALLRRTLRQPVIPRPARKAADWLAAAAAAIWAAHPLQTESVTYIAQRAESLAAFFYLLTLWAFARAQQASRPQAWRALAFLACLLGVATKETVATAPLVVLLYDRTFVSGSFRSAWQRNGRMHFALASTWLLTGWLVWQTGSRGGTAGAVSGVSPWSYALTQAGGVVHYLRLSLWPQPLVFDYGTGLVSNWTDVWPQLLVVGLLAIATIWALVFRPLTGFAAAFFFAALAPSSSFVPVATQTLAEHRMYLPLAAIVVLLLCASHRLAGRRAIPLWLAAAAALGLTTAARNRVYRSEIALWRDTVASRPENARGHYNLANELFKSGDAAAAIVHYREALRLGPERAEMRVGLANALFSLDRWSEAEPEYQAALRLESQNVAGLVDFANALARNGRTAEAIEKYTAALHAQPDNADAHYNLAATLAQAGRPADAATHYEAALRRDPSNAAAESGLAFALRRTGRATDALPHYAAAARLRPSDPDLHYNLASALLEAGREREAAAEFAAVLQLRPDDTDARQNLDRLQTRRSPP
jgi:tetratricopeptide (TPR) repeat protein